MDVETLERLVDTDRDSAMLRLTLARLLTGEGKHEAAEAHLQEAVRMDPGYTAAWKELGKVRNALEDPTGAREAWASGIEAAELRGDKQAAKEMTVFLRRLAK